MNRMFEEIEINDRMTKQDFILIQNYIKKLEETVVFQRNEIKGLQDCIREYTKTFYKVINNQFFNSPPVNRVFKK